MCVHVYVCVYVCVIVLWINCICPRLCAHCVSRVVEISDLLDEVYSRKYMFEIILKEIVELLCGFIFISNLNINPYKWQKRVPHWNNQQWIEAGNFFVLVFRRIQVFVEFCPWIWKRAGFWDWGHKYIAANILLINSYKVECWWYVGNWYCVVFRMFHWKLLRFSKIFNVLSPFSFSYWGVLVSLFFLICVPDASWIYCFETIWVVDGKYLSFKFFVCCLMFFVYLL